MSILYLTSRAENSHEDESGRGHSRVLGRAWILGIDSWVSVLSLLQKDTDTENEVHFLCPYNGHHSISF